MRWSQPTTIDVAIDKAKEMAEAENETVQVYVKHRFTDSVYIVQSVNRPANLAWVDLVAGVQPDGTVTYSQNPTS